jgi:hypothetical protein
MPWRRVLRTPLILLGINLAVGVLTAGVVYGYGDDQLSRRDRLTSALQTLSYHRATVAEDQAYIEANQAAYDALIAGGLLAEQDRLEAARLLELLGRQHGLHGIRYSFSPQRSAPLGPGRLAQTTLLTTEVAIEMTAALDLDLLAYARSVAARLPGDVRVIGFSLERRYDVDPDLLGRLRAGQRVDVVAGRLRLEWRALRGRGAAEPTGPTPS